MLVYRGFAWRPCCMAGTIKMFCIRMNILSHRNNIVLFLARNMAAMQNLYILLLDKLSLRIILICLHVLKCKCLFLTWTYYYHNYPSKKGIMSNCQSIFCGAERFVFSIFCQLNSSPFSQIYFRNNSFVNGAGPVEKKNKWRNKKFTESQPVRL